MSTTQDVKLSPEQDAAIALCCDFDERIVGVTGGAGTGKTVVLGRTHQVLKDEGKRVVLCAPTGRAAKRIEELTKIKAVTLHRLLEFPQPGEDGTPGEPRRNRSYRLEYDVVIVDEASMVSSSLFQQLEEAMPNNGVIRMFGDNNQLPPVERGLPPFVDVLERRASQTLTYNYRSDDAIVSNALRILRGSIPVRNDRFEIVYCAQPLVALREMLKDNSDFMHSDNQIILPQRKGQSGTTHLNVSLQVMFNPTGPILRLDRFDENDPPLTVRVNDKFLWVKNDYQLNLYNGETGMISDLSVEDGTIGVVTSDNREVIVPASVRTYSKYHDSYIQYDPRKQLELGYAVTTHKSQGSEYDTIVYCISDSHAYMLNRRNFYTAITRAKKRVVVVTTRRAMGMAVRPYRER